MARPTYLFYEVMNYPVPFHKEFFAYEEVVDTVKKPNEIDFSWAKPQGPMQAYVDHVNRLGWLWRSLPFVESVYVANSMTFNALHDESDIDLFFVVSAGRMWVAKLSTGLVMSIFRLLRTKRVIAKRCSLSFFVSQDGMNLQPIKLAHADPYLVYWLAHLVPIYHRRAEDSLDIYEHNYRLREYLPSFPMEQVIHLGLTVHTGTTRVKNMIERLLGAYIGYMLQRCIKTVWVPLLLLKKKRLGAMGKQMIVSDTMLKFHADKRVSYAMKWKIAKRKKG